MRATAIDRVPAIRPSAGEIDVVNVCRDLDGNLVRKLGVIKWLWVKTNTILG